MSSHRFTSRRGKKLTGLARKYPLDRTSWEPGGAAAVSAAVSPPGHILLAAPTPQAVATTTATLARGGYRVATVIDVDEALQVMARERIDLLIIGSAGGSDSIARLLRRVRSYAGIAHAATSPATIALMVLLDRSAPNAEGRRRAALAAGADDVLVAPYSPGELLLRVATLLRRIARTPAAPRDTLSLADLHIDIAAHQVFVRERTVVLTAAEFTTLQTLAERRGQLCTRDSLAMAVRGNTGRGVDVRISRIRRKLGDAGIIIECVRGRGYRLARVEAAAS